MKKVLFIFLLVMTYCVNGHATPYTYQSPPASLLSYKGFVEVKMEAGTVDISSALATAQRSKNFDYTQTLQTLINKYKKVRLPGVQMFINDNGLSIPSGARIYFSKGTVLKMLPSRKTHFDALKIYDVQDVQIYNAVIEGDKLEHLGNTGEWAAGIGLRNAQNVVLKYGSVKNTWGDGVFIGSESGGVSRNITLSNFNIDNARRNGISITSGIDVLVSQVTISNTAGTAPECAVDIEPSLPSEELKNIQLTDVITFNNRNGGINVNTNALSSHTTNHRKVVSITIDRHRDYQSNYSFGYSIEAEGARFQPSGVVLYRDSYSENPRAYYYWKTPQKKTINYQVKNFRGIMGNAQKSINDQNF